jgi:hypothetical protein
MRNDEDAVKVVAPSASRKRDPAAEQHASKEAEERALWDSRATEAGKE